MSDVGLSLLLSFLSKFLVVVAHVLFLASLKDFAKKLPKNVAGARTLLGKNTDKFDKYACCPSCSAILPIDQCKVRTTDGFESMTCPYIRFPNHPQIWRRKTCSTILLKKVKTSSGTVVLKPRQTYCYHSVIDYLRRFLAQPGFQGKCEEWRTRNKEVNVFSDIYDGRIWAQFQAIDGVPFLQVPYNYALTLNVDWFQPFKHTQHSIGVMYLAINNLPREIRFLPENVLIVGIIPGPHEPSKHINTFITPLVEELLLLWSGVVLDIDGGQSVLVRAALVLLRVIFLLPVRFVDL